MPDKIRKSILARLIALGFIYVIVLGNVWFAMGISGNPTPSWMMYSFFFGLCWLLFSGLGLTIQWLYLWQAGALYSGDEYGVNTQV